MRKEGGKGERDHRKERKESTSGIRERKQQEEKRKER